MSPIATSRIDTNLLITIDRPHRRNALTPAMVEQLCAAFDEADRDDKVRAVIVTGAGGSFSTGADLSGGSLEAPKQADGESTERDFGGVLALRIFASTKPVIAAVNGDAVGLGSTMLLPMDVRLCTEEARFGFVFTRRGIVPEACSTWFLPRIVGVSRALRWTMSGRLISSSEACEAGLIDSVHVPAELLDAALGVAAELTAASSPLSVSATRRLLWSSLTFDHPMQSHRAESELVRALARMPDAREGISAFLDKRPANYLSSPAAELPRFAALWPDPAFAPE